MSEPEKRPVGFFARIFSELRRPPALRESKPEKNTFTPLSQQVLVLARRETERLGRDLPDTEHLLLGLLRLNQGVGMNILIKQGVALESLRVEIEKQAGMEPRPKMSGKSAFSDGIKKILSYAAREARTMDHAYVGTGHILLGMLREQDGLAGCVLRSLGLTFEAARAQALQEPETDMEESASSKIPNSNYALAGGLDQGVENNFTPRALQIFLLAHSEAERLKQNYVGTEHLLLGLITLGQGCAFQVLLKLNVNIERLRAEVVKEIVNFPPQPVAVPVRHTPGTSKVINLAATEAKAQNYKYVGTEYLLLGMLLEEEGIAGRVLRKTGLEIDRTRTEVLKELDPNYRPKN